MIDQEALERRDRAFSQWRKKANEKMPRLATKVFSFRGKNYSGSGFQWVLERRLGHALAWLNDQDARELYHTPEASMFQIILKLHMKALIKDVKRIDAELKIRCEDRKDAIDSAWTHDVETEDDRVETDEDHNFAIESAWTYDRTLDAYDCFVDFPPALASELGYGGLRFFRYPDRPDQLHVYPWKDGEEYAGTVPLDLFRRLQRLLPLHAETDEDR